MTPKEKRALRGPTGQSFRSLKRAAAAGWEPRQPDEKAKKRHAWYQRLLFWNAMRERLGIAVE